MVQMNGVATTASIIHLTVQATSVTVLFLKAENMSSDD